MKINKQVKFYVYLKSKLGRNADLLNFMFLQELGTGKYVLPELCKQLEVSRSNFNASLIRLKKEGVICYSGHSSNGILLWWIKKSIEDEPSHKQAAPRWVIVDKETREFEEIILGEEEIWALKNGYNVGTFKNFLFGRYKCFADKYELVKNISQDLETN